ncbi:proline-rich protein 2-like [Cinclus cinclus]|uniref:proline-rich protein 2-like n=1 Tax=Cinclus cinclus TaxID=127875 RepID=UPI002E15E276
MPGTPRVPAAACRSPRGNKGRSRPRTDVSPLGRDSPAAGSPKEVPLRARPHWVGPRGSALPPERIGCPPRPSAAGRASRPPSSLQRRPRIPPAPQSRIPRAPHPPSSSEPRIPSSPHP